MSKLIINKIKIRKQFDQNFDSASSAVDVDRTVSCIIFAANVPRFPCVYFTSGQEVYCVGIVVKLNLVIIFKCSPISLYDIVVPAHPTKTLLPIHSRRFASTLA